MKEKLVIRFFGLSDAGLTREHNEDYYAIDEDNMLFVVADGLGGCEDGEVASKLAAGTILKYFNDQKNLRTDKTSTRNKIADAIQQAHENILDLSLADGIAKKMGTTVVLGIFQSPDSFYIANVGDSRAYLYRDQKFKLISQDHSVVYQLFQQGEITYDQMRTHHMRNIVTQALGIEIFRGCYCKKINLIDKDTIILCSDGLWEMIPDATIAKIMSKTKGPEESCAQLVEAAKRAGGKDNITVIVIAVNKF